LGSETLSYFYDQPVRNLLKTYRRLVQLTLDNEKSIFETMDMLLAKKRSQDRKYWLEKEGDLADPDVI
jgi:hypothetical protein